MTLKSDAKFEEKLNRRFKDNKNLVNLSRAFENLKNLYFNGLLQTKVYNV